MDTQVQEAPGLRSARLKKAGLSIKAKTTRFQLQELFIKDYHWIWQEVRVLVKSGPVGGCSGCGVTRGDVETARWQLAGVTGGVLGTVHRKQLRFSAVQRCV